MLGRFLTRQIFVVGDCLTLVGKAYGAVRQVLQRLLWETIDQRFAMHQKVSSQIKNKLEIWLAILSINRSVAAHELTATFSFLWRRERTRVVGQIYQISRKGVHCCRWHSQGSGEQIFHSRPNGILGLTRGTWKRCLEPSASRLQYYSSSFVVVRKLIRRLWAWRAWRAWIQR